MRRFRVPLIVVGLIALIIGGWWVLITYSPIPLRPWVWTFPVLSVLLTLASAVRAIRGSRSAGEPVAPKRTYVVPQTLPPAPVVIGRDEELSAMVDYLGRDLEDGQRRIVVVHGQPGMGKTALAINVARRLVQTYQDGVLFAWLGGKASTESHLRDFVVSLQHQDEPVPIGLEPLVERYRALTAKKRRHLLVVLDDAPDAEAVLPFLPACAGCAVIVTSRAAIRIPGAWTLPEPLQPLNADDSIRLLESLVGQNRIEREPEATRQIAEGAHGSPLALHLAAMSIAARPYWTLGATLESVPLRSVGQKAEPQSPSALDLSFYLLTEQERRALLLLGLLDERRFEPWMLAALMDMELERVAWRLCDRLVHAGLLEHVVDDSTGIAAFRVLEHVFDYVRAKAGDHGLDAAQALSAKRRLEEVGKQRGRRDLSKLLREDVYPDLEQGRISSALNNVRGALAQARLNVTRASTALEEAGAESSADDEHAPERRRLNAARDAEGLALAALAEVLAELGNLDEATEMAAAALRTATKPARPRALRCIGNVRRRENQLDLAADTLSRGLDAAREIGHASEQVRIWREIALLRAVHGDIEDSLEAVRNAMATQLRDNSRNRLLPSVMWAKAVVLTTRFEREGNSADLAEATGSLQEASVIARDHGQHLWLAWIAYQHARIQRHCGHLTRGRAIALQTAEDFMNMRHRYGAALCRLEVARSHVQDELYEDALHFLEDARQTFLFCEDRLAEARTIVELAEVQLQLGRVKESTGFDLQLAVKHYTDLGEKSGRERAEGLLRRVNDVVWSPDRGVLSLMQRPQPALGGLWSAPATPGPGR